MGEATQIADADSLKADLRSLIGRTIGSPDAKVMARMIMRTIGEIADDPDLMAIYRERVLRPRLNQASALVRRARARGELRKDLPADLAAMPIAMRAYAGRTCAYCDKVIGDIDFLKHNSGVIGSDWPVAGMDDGAS
jgi:hypothetical protein